MHRRPVIVSLATAVLATVVLATACSVNFSIGGQSVEDAAIELIEGELSDQLGSQLTATCPTIAEPEVGVEFICTGETADGELIRFDGVVDREDHIELVTTNVVSAEALMAVEAEIEAQVERRGDVNLDVACGTPPVVMDSRDQVRCTVTLPDANLTGPATVTFTDPGEGTFNIATDSELTRAIDQSFAASGAVDIIGQLSDQLDLPLTDVQCPDTIDPTEGTVFECTASSALGTIFFDGTVGADVFVNVSTRNVLTGDDLGRFAAAATDVLQPQGDVVIDCGSDVVVLAPSSTFDCDAALRDGSRQGQATVEITDFETLDFVVELDPAFVAALESAPAAASDEDALNQTAVFELIDQLSDQVGIPVTNVSCPDTISPAEGTEFECSASSELGTVFFDGDIGADVLINVFTRNVLVTDDLGRFAGAAVDALEPVVGERITIDCGTGPVLLDASLTFDCDATSADGTATAIARIEITDLDTLNFVVNLVE